MLKYNKPKQAIEPNVYMIALHASSNGNVLIWNTAVAAFSLEQAKSEAVATLKVTDPTLHQNGVNLGGWHLKNHIELSPVKLDGMLASAYNDRNEIEQERERQERNELMQTIVDTASRKLLNKYRDRFTSAEVGYLEDEITSYERNT